MLDVFEFAVEALAGGRRVALPQIVQAPANALGWSVQYGWIFQPYEMQDATDDGEIVFLVEHGKVEGIEGDAPLAAILRVDRVMHEFQQRVLSDLAQLRGEVNDLGGDRA